MDLIGIIENYPANRPLTERERTDHLRQNQRLHIEPRNLSSVITMNSTYLEAVDKGFGWRGAVTALAMLLQLLCLAGLLCLGGAVRAFATTEEPAFLLAIGLGATVLLVYVGWCLVRVLRTESFGFTHFPIRFNRKTRMVYVFRINGSVLSIPWDHVYFTQRHMRENGEFEVLGNVLAPDNMTVRESFPLSYLGWLDATVMARGHGAYRDLVCGHWEFIRRYMEDGPHTLQGQVQFCMPVDGRRESVKRSVHRVFANISGAPVLLYLMLWPQCAVVSLFRLFAMRTSKVPLWPKEIDAACMVEPGDPYAIEGDADGNRVAVYPDAALAAGVFFGAPPGPVERSRR
jgi:hypothetical protein